MPLIQKVIRVGDSRAVTLPATWLEYCERKSGQKITEVTVEVNGQIIIKPMVKETVANEENRQ